MKVNVLSNTRPKTPGVFISLQQGFTLLELVAVVLILSVVALVAMPSFRTSDPAQLDAAAQVFAEGMQFARSEAMRLGEPMGFRQQNVQQRMRVFSLDTGTAPWTVQYDVYHPIHKQLWDIKLADLTFAKADSVDTNKDFIGTCNTVSNIYFDTHGIARCADPHTVPLERYEVILVLDGHTRTVTLDGFSGKVTVQ